MDIARPEFKQRKRRRQIALIAGIVVVVAILTAAVYRLKPAAPSVERGTVWTDTVKRGSMLRQVRGIGSLVPSQESVLQIPAETEATIIRIRMLPGSLVKPDTVICDMSDPSVEQAAVDAHLQWKAAQAEYQSARMKLESDVMNQKAGAATVKADYNQTQLQSQTDKSLYDLGVISGLAYKASKSKADELTIRNGLEDQRLESTQKSIDAQLAQLQAKVDQMRVLAELKQKQLDALKVRAGIDGVLVELPLHEAQILKQAVHAPISMSKFAEPQQQIQFFDQMLQKVRALPGVESAGVADDVPLNGNGSHQPIQIEGQPVVAMADQPEVDVRLISSGYMPSMRTSILRGRDFSDEDIAGRPAAILISKSMAERFWPGENPIGKRLTLTFSPEQVREVVGVVGDVKLDGLDQARPSTAVYVPLGQLSKSSQFDFHSFPMTLVVRSTTSPGSMVSTVTNAVHEVDRDMPVRDIFTMDDMVANSLLQPRFNMLLLGVFAALAVLLAGVGIYSVLSYSVRQRVPEIGIRLALGARLTDVLRLVLIEGMKPALLGVVIGIGGALALGKVVASLVYQVKPSDPLTFAGVVTLLGMIALLACLIPAYRASRVDPIIALRNE